MGTSFCPSIPCVLAFKTSNQRETSWLLMKTAISICRTFATSFHCQVTIVLTSSCKQKITRKFRRYLSIKTSKLSPSQNIFAISQGKISTQIIQTLHVVNSHLVFFLSMKTFRKSQTQPPSTKC